MLFRSSAKPLSVSILTISAALTVIAPGEIVNATPDYSPQFNRVSRYRTTISGNNDSADIYFPNPPNLRSGNYSFPVVLLLQGALVDKSFYSDYASLVARYGFVVIVPNHLRPATTAPGAPLRLLPETSQIAAVLAQMEIEAKKPASPITGVVDTQKLGLLGHSFGSAVGLSAIANQCLPFLCTSSFTRPKELLAGAFFGANLRNQTTGEFISINNAGIAVALLQGDRDGVALPFRAERTYDNIQTPPKALLTVLGVNHFGITNVNNPMGARPDPTSPTLEQSVAVETTARWSALFLRSSMLSDPSASDYIYSTGDRHDPNVSVTSTAVPKPLSIAGLFVFGVMSVAHCWRNRCK